MMDLRKQQGSESIAWLRHRLTEVTELCLSERSGACACVRRSWKIEAVTRIRELPGPRHADELLEHLDYFMDPWPLFGG
jgi:hypothetical protein